MITARQTKLSKAQTARLFHDDPEDHHARGVSSCPVGLRCLDTHAVRRLFSRMVRACRMTVNHPDPSEPATRPSNWRLLPAIVTSSTYGRSIVFELCFIRRDQTRCSIDVKQSVCTYCSDYSSYYTGAVNIVGMSTSIHLTDTYYIRGSAGSRAAYSTSLNCVTHDTHQHYFVGSRSLNVLTSMAACRHTKVPV